MSPDRAPGAEEIAGWIVTRLAARLDIAEDEIDPRDSLAVQGLSSRRVLGLLGELERWLDRDLPSTLPWEFPSVDALAQHLAAPGEAAREPEAAEPAGGQPVAIVGIGCRLPGASGPAELWRMLLEGRDAVGPAPAGRRALFDRLAPAPELQGELGSWPGGYLEGVDRFDAGFFGISRREAEGMDPQQRILLEVAWEALEDAGIVDSQLRGSRTGVFVGISTRDYGELRTREPGRSDAYLGTGTTASIAANRISYLLDLHGPSLAIDTACSSSLVAIDAARAGIASGECSLALAGGVNLILSPALTIGFARGGFLSPRGRCRTFDRAADGYVRGEGCGLVVLKPLARALADRDRIHAVILGSGVEQDGRSSGLTAPSPAAQRRLLKRVLARAGVAPSEVRYVEAHGTGTVLGDRIELEALGATVGAGREGRPPCLVGSIKTNLGHLEAAAGIAGLIKAALVASHGRVPPSLHFEAPNEDVDLDALSLAVPTAAGGIAIGAGGGSSARGPVVGVSSFGFGGTGAHVVLAPPPGTGATEAPDEKTTDGGGADARPGYLLPISARSEASLRRLARALRDRLAADPGSLDAVCRTAAGRRSGHDHRLAVVGAGHGEVVEAIGAYLAGEPHRGVLTGQVPTDRVGTGRGEVGRGPAVAFRCGGEDPDPEAVAELFRAEPAFRSALVEICDLARLHAEIPLLEILLRQREPEPGERAAAAPLARLAVSWAVSRLWRSWGVVPDHVVAGEDGRIAAALVAESLELPEAIERTLEGNGAAAGGEGPGDAVAPGPGAREAEPIVLGTGLAASGPSSPGRGALLRALARLYSAGRPIDWRGLHPDPAPPTDLPPYPWDRQSFWFDEALSPAAPSGATAPPASEGPLPAAGATGAPDASGLRVWEVELGGREQPFLRHHRVHGAVVLPVSYYIELALRAAASVFAGERCAVTSLRFERLLELSAETPRPVRVRITPAGADAARFAVLARPGDGSGPEWVRHARGAIERRPAAGAREVRCGSA